MRRLELDFHAVPSRPWAAMLCMSSALALSALALVQHQRAAGELLRWQEALTIRQSAPLREPKPPAEAQKRTAAQVREFAAANSVIRKLVLPWEDLFKAVEQASGNDIALLAIEPDATKKVIKLTAESHSAQSMLAFILRLQRSPALAGVLLQRHDVQLKDPDKPLRFIILARWR
jgi:hypothetical protein